MLCLLVIVGLLLTIEVAHSQILIEVGYPQMSANNYSDVQLSCDDTGFPFPDQSVVFMLNNTNISDHISGVMETTTNGIRFTFNQQQEGIFSCVHEDEIASVELAATPHYDEQIINRYFMIQSEDQPVEIPCAIQPGLLVDKYSVEWRTILASGDIINFPDATFSITRNVTPSDTATFQCIVTIDHETTSDGTISTRSMYTGPHTNITTKVLQIPFDEVLLLNQTITLGTSVQFTCTVAASYRIIWRVGETDYNCNLSEVDTNIKCTTNDSVSELQIVDSTLGPGMHLIRCIQQLEIEENFLNDPSFQEKYSIIEHQAALDVILFGCEDGSVLLYNGSHVSRNFTEGIVLVCSGGIYGSVCDDYWDNLESTVVCSQLGHANEGYCVALKGPSKFGEFIGPIVLDDLLCTGTEENLTQCTIATGNHQCTDHGEDAGVMCNHPTPCEEGALRLVPNNVTANELYMRDGGVGEFRFNYIRDEVHRGRLEVCSNGDWGIACSHTSWTHNIASFACQRLTFSSIGALAVNIEDPGPSTSNLFCNIEDGAWSCQSCAARAALVCQDILTTKEENCTDGDIRLSNGSNILDGRVEICYNKAWGTICSDGFGTMEAEVICSQIDSQFGYAHNGSTPILGAGFGEGPIYIDDLECDGTEARLEDCQLLMGFHNCQHSQDVGVRCHDADECGPDGINRCDKQSRAICRNTIGSHECACRNGFTGNGETCKDIDECTEGLADCHPNNSTCTNTEGSFNCACVTGYTGDGVNCSRVNLCEVADCHSNAFCVDEDGGFQCVCNSGYTGNGTVCEDINECDSTSVCPENAACTNTDGNYTCTCDNGFTGNRMKCFDIDECAIEIHNCSEGATCSNTVGSYECTCGIGYRTNGSLCEEINECLDSNPCHFNADCRNNIGSYECKCKGGFTGDGIINCTKYSNECDSMHCADNETCENINGNYMCTRHRKGNADDKNRKSYLLTALLVPLLLGVFIFAILLFVGFAIWHIRRLYYKKEAKCSIQERKLPEPPSLQPPQGFVEQIKEELGRRNMLFLKHHLQLTKVIGEGESGLVYRGYTYTGECVAVKTGKALVIDNDKEKLLKEVSLMMSFNHPNIMPLVGMCFDGEVPLLIMPFMSDGSVLDYVRGNIVTLDCRKSSSEEQIQTAAKKCMSMCYQIAKGMSYLAMNRFVHRDLAARNCMIDGFVNGVIKVADFGMAEDMYGTNYCNCNAKEKEERVPLKWMAPESIENNIYSESSDVWSYGVTCWEVFTCGRIPYTGVPVMTLLSELHSGQRLTRPSNIACSDSMWDLMKSCWVVKPEDRPNFNEIIHKLTNILECDPSYLKLV